VINEADIQTATLPDYPAGNGHFKTRSREILTMASNYSEIKIENERRYGTDIGRIVPMLLADCYDDRTLRYQAVYP